MLRSKLFFLAAAVVLVIGSSAQAQAPNTNYDQQIIANGPVIYYPCNEPLGSYVATDWSGHGNNGQYGTSNNTDNIVTLGTSLASGYTLGGANLTQLGTFGAYANQSSNVHASGLFMPQTVPQMDVGTGNFTAEWWYTTTNATRDYLFNWETLYSGTSYSSIQIFSNTTNSDVRISDANYQNGGLQNILRADTSNTSGTYSFSPAANTLYDLVVTRTAGVYAIYINGASKQLYSSYQINGGAIGSYLSTNTAQNPYGITNITSTASQYNPSWDSPLPQKSLGDNQTGTPPANGTSGPGNIGQFAFYNYALSPTVIASDYAVAQTANTYVPEPSTLALLAAGLAGLLCYAWRKRR